MKRVLIITYYWPPAGGPGVQRWLKFVKFLPEMGITPYVITVDPKEASYPVFDHSLAQDLPSDTQVTKTKTFELYDLYKKLLNKKEIPYSGFASESEPQFMDKVVRFLRSNLFIPDPRVGWNKYAIRKAKQLIHEHGIDTIITTSPPHSTQLIGFALKKAFPHLKWIADLRDPWTDIYYYNQLYHSRLSKYLDKKLERKVVTAADEITVVGESMRENLLRRYHAQAKDKISVLYNGFDGSDFENVIPEKQDKFTITYTGTLSDQYPVDGFLRAVEQVSEKMSDINVRIVGRVTPGIQATIQASDVSHLFSFIDQVEHKEAIRYMSNSDVLLLVIPNTLHNEDIITGKIFEYIACKKAILGVGPVRGNAAQILQQSAAGQMFDYANWKGMASFITQYLSKSKSELSCEDRHVDRYSRKELTKKLVDIINRP